MDKIYLMSYALISLVLLRIIRSGNATAKGGNDGIKTIIRRERRLAAGYLAVFVLGVVILSLL